ncbi:MAG: hypothetical protein AB2A00_04440 [Myxococcota bacterium]
MKKSEWLLEWDWMLLCLRGVLTLLEMLEMEPGGQGRVVTAIRAMVELMVDHMEALSRSENE